jgi:hypothetical protein
MHARFLFAATLLACGFAPAAPTLAAEPTFSHDVYPIVRKHCWSCHSGSKAEGKLRFDDVDGVRRGGESGPLFVPGKPDASTLIEQVSGKKPAMPPEGSPLAAAEVDVLRRWIAAGGKVDRMPQDASASVVVPQTYAFAPAITSVAVSPDGRLAACACRSEAVLVPLDDEKSSPPTKTRRLPTDCDLLTHVEFSPDGKLLAAAGGTPARFGAVHFFDVATGKLVASRRLTNDTLFRGSFSPDGKRIALGASDGGVYLVPVDAKAEVKRIELHSDWAVDVAWTPDGTKLVSVGRDKTTKVASAESGQLLRTIDSSTERMNAVAADDKFGVSAGLAKTMNGYDFSIALENVELSGSGNGARPVSRAAQYTRAFEGQPGEVLDLALSGDQRLLATAGQFAEIRLYTLVDRKRVGAVPYAAGSAYAVALNADATRLVVGGRSGKLDVFQLPDGALLRSIDPVPVQGR